MFLCVFVSCLLCVVLGVFAVVLFDWWLCVCLRCNICVAVLVLFFVLF